MKIKNCHPKIKDGTDLRLLPQLPLHMIPVNTVAQSFGCGCHLFRSHQPLVDCIFQNAPGFLANCSFSFSLKRRHFFLHCHSNCLLVSNAVFRGLIIGVTAILISLVLSQKESAVLTTLMTIMK